MIATVAKFYKGEGQEVIVTAESSSGEVIGVSPIKTFRDVAMFFTTYPAITSIQHGGFVAPSLPTPTDFPDYIPGAIKHNFPEGSIQNFPKGFPESVVIGGMGALGKGIGVVHYLKGLGLQSVVVLRDGTVHQIGTLTSYGQTVAGACINIVPECDGCVLKKSDGSSFQNYFTGASVSASDVRYRDGKHYHTYTPEQEKKILDICVWLVKQSKGLLSAKSIIGLQEAISVDAPGGSSQHTMKDFRTVVAAILGEQP